MSVTGRLDFLGCTASAFEANRPGETVFVPFGRAGSAYAARDPARMQALASRVRVFCTLAALILGGWLALLASQRFDYDADRWRYGYALGAAFVIWMLAYALWAWRATRRLEKVRA